jgi:hypothetical protein
MALECISNAKARSSKKKAASSNKAPSPGVVSASFSALPEKDVKAYGNGSPSPSSNLTSEQDSSSKYEYGSGTNAASEDASKYGYGEASHEADSQCGYRDTAPSDDGSSRPSKTPRRSSMKQGSHIGCRASIRCTGEIEVKLPGQRDPVRRRISISFSEEHEVKEVERLSSLTDDAKALWFQKEELKDIKTKLRTIIHTLERGKKNTKKICIRGLERHIGQLSKTKINAAWDAVVIEQCMQQNKGSFDDETISMRYKIFARGSKEKAAERAKEDEAAIAKYQRDTRRMMRRISA